jgi:hypothetical protein
MRFRHLSTAPRSTAQRRRLVLTGVALAAAALCAWQIAQNQRAASLSQSGAMEQREGGTRESFSDARLAAEVHPRPAMPSPRRGNVAAAALDRSLLDSVRDDMLGVRRSEAEAFFAVLDHVRHISADELAAAARSDVQYAHLMDAPEQFRGDVVSISGTLVRCEQFAAADATRTPRRLYEAWVHSDDAGGTVRIVAPHADPRLLSPGAMHVPVQVAGCFFKREGYESSQGLRFAPTILAPSIAVDGSRQASVMSGEPLPPGLAAAIGLIFLATLWALAWTNRHPRRLPASLPPLSSTVEAAVAQIDPRSVSEQLRALSERHRFGTVR